jgi:hypothetical protein
MLKAPGIAVQGFEMLILRPPSRLVDSSSRPYNPFMIEYGVIVLLVASAAIYLLCHFVRGARGKDAGCSASCGCSVTGRRADRLGRRIDLIQLNANPPFTESSDAQRTAAHQ